MSLRTPLGRRKRRRHDDERPRARWVEQAADLVVNDGDHPQPGHDNVANEHCGQNVAARLTKENL